MAGGRAMSLSPAPEPLWPRAMRDGTDPRPPAGLAFLKMHGLGNDFVVLDLRDGAPPPGPATIRALGDRHRGVGFDQLALVAPDAGSAARLIFHNPDGSRSGACGNATRCIARWLMEEAGTDAVTLRTDRGLLAARDAGGGLTSVNMGAPLLHWCAVPLAREVDLLHLPADLDGRPFGLGGVPVATGFGNPHCTFFADDAAAVDLAAVGRRFEIDPLFPERTNVEVAEVRGRDRIRVRVWERGTGVTQASGSCAAAAAVAAARRGLTERRLDVELDGGVLTVDWREDGVWVTGPTAHVFSGRLSPSFVAVP